MRKNKLIIIAIVIIILAGGGYAIFHKSSKPASHGTSGTSKSTGQSNAPAVNNAVLVTKTDASIGQYLADRDGKALYTYNGDSSGVSNCTGSCLVNWPAYVDKGSTTDLPAGVGTIKRADNSQIQYTYNGMPLYYFVNDGAGQVTGDGVENFKVAKPAASSSSGSTAPASSSSSPSSSSSSSSPSYNY